MRQPLARLLAPLEQMSLRTKLAGGFIAVVGLALIVGGVSLWSQQRARAAVEQYLDVDGRIADLSLRCTIGMIKARKNEKDFLLKEREFSFYEAKSRYGTLLQAELADIRTNMGIIRRLRSDADLDRRTRAVELATVQYEAGFMRLVDIYGRLGRMDTGLEGQFRAKAHEMEAIIEASGTEPLMADLLAMRRHEKDFLMRGLDKNAHKYTQALARFRADLARTALPSRKKEALARLAGEYGDLFDHYVALRAAIQPETETYLSAVHEIESHLEVLYAQSVRFSTATGATVQRWTRATGWMIAIASLAAALAGLAISFIIFRSISRSVATSMAFAGRIARGDLATRLAQQGGLEFRKLAASLNAMADALMDARVLEERKKAELLEANGVLGERTEQLTAVNEKLTAQIEERVRAQGALEKEVATSQRLLAARDAAQLRFRRIVETAEEGIWMIDGEARTTYMNRRMGDMLGLEPDHVMGTAAAECVREDCRAAFQSRIALAAAARGAAEQFECWLSRRDGAAFCGLVCMNAMVDESGSQVGVLAMVSDISERQRLQEAAAANRAKSAFLASMSHEIRTPLNAILGYSQLMVRDGQLGVEARRNIEVINRSGEHLLALVNDVLEMSKIEAGRVTLDPVTFDLHALLQDLEEMFRLRAHGKGLSFEVVKTEAIPCCLVADEGKVRQVLVNLLGNAAKFTQSGRISLRVSATRTGGRLWVTAEVQDTGPGIAGGELTNLFQRFGQTESGRQEQTGTGLGLAISREHARLMGGDIGVTSEPGKGSVFVFEFPAEEGCADECEMRAAAPRRVAGIKLAGAAPRVLLVDDQDANRGWLRQLLTLIGFEVREATDGREAVESWQAWKPELVLMDMHMPEMDGYEATRAIRRRPGGEDVVIIALSASAFAENRRDVLRNGADDFLGKPVREAKLLEKIREHLGLEYIYAGDPPAGAGAAACGGEALSPEALARVPGHTLRAMREATRIGDLDRLRSLIAEAERTAGPAIGALHALADRFDYEGLRRTLGDGTSRPES